MAYIPASVDPNKKPGEYALAASGGAPGAVASGSAPSSPPPASDGGQRFGALRSFFSANQPAADAQVGGIMQPIEDKAKEVQRLGNQAAVTTASEGGADLAGRAVSARDEVMGTLRDTESVGGMAGLLGEGKASDYTEGQRNADAYLYGRAPGWDSFRDKWRGLIGSFKGTYRPDPVTPVPSDVTPATTTKPIDPTGKYGKDQIDPEPYDPRHPRGERRQPREVY